MEYMLVTSSDSTNLSEMVTEAMAKGYRPYGDPTLAMVRDSRGYEYCTFCQAVVLEDKPEEDSATNTSISDISELDVIKCIENTVNSRVKYRNKLNHIINQIDLLEDDKLSTDIRKLDQNLSSRSIIQPIQENFGIGNYNIRKIISNLLDAHMKGRPRDD